VNLLVVSAEPWMVAGVMPRAQRRLTVEVASSRRA
jgi:hypothetical protein